MAWIREANMYSGGLRIVGVGCLLLALEQTALGGQFSDPSGFSFTYPQGWTAVNREVLEKATNELAQQVKDWVTKNRVDFNQVKVAIIHEGEGDFLENVNVV